MRGRTSQSDFSRSQSCSTKRSIRNLSPLTKSIPRENAREFWGKPRHSAVAACLRAHSYAGGISDGGRVVSRRRNRGLRHPAYFCFVSFALRASKN